MSWKIFAVVVSVTLAAVSASPVNTCVLQKDTAMEQFKLSNLNRLIGETLTTESNGNIYLVSICRPISKLFYDPRKLAGALKMTSDGDTIGLGRIDQTDVVVNEDTIVLTYVGGDMNMNSKDTCKGQRWTTYMTFICDPLVTSDVLTLIDEDPDQPEICQVWFEIKTSKTCVRQPQIPLNVLENDFIEHNKAIEKKINTEILKNNSNEIHSGNNSTNNEKNESITSKYPVNEENNSNQNYSHYSSTELPVPFIYIHSNATNDIKLINNENKENNGNKSKLHNDKSNKSSSIENNNFIKEIKSTDEEMKIRNSTQTNLNENKEDNLNKNTHAEKSSIKENNNSKTNINLSDQKNKINHQNNNSDDLLNINKNYNSSKEQKSDINKNKDDNLNKNTHDEKSSNKENNNSGMNKNLSGNKNKENSQNAHSIDILPKNESDNSGKEIKSRNHENISSNKNTSEGNSFNNEKSYPGKHANSINHNSLQANNSKSEPSHNENYNTGNDNESTNYVHKEDNLNKNTTGDNSFNNENTNFKTYKNPSENKNSQNNVTEYKSTRNENDSPGNTDNKEDNLNKNTIKNDSEINDGKFPGKGMANDKNSSGNYEKSLDKNNNTIYDINKSNNSLLNNTLYNNTEKIPSENEDKSSNDTNKADNSNENYSKNNNNTISNTDHNTTAVIAKLPKNNSQNTTINDNVNQSSEIKHSSTEKTATGSINNDTNINDNSELNSTIINNVNKDVQTSGHSTPESNSILPDSSTSSNNFNNNDNNNYNNSNTTAGGTNLPGDDLNFSNLFKKIFPNGIQLSVASITGGLGVLMSIYVAVGTAINRYYYKKTGTDQIPLKGAFQSIKGFITNTFGCCIGNLEAQDVTNEKSPLLSPKFVNETSRRSSNDESNQGKGGNYNNDTNSDQNNKKKYGSMSNETDSPTTEKNIRKKSSSNKTSSESVKEDIFNTVNELKGKSIKEVIHDKMNTIVPTVKHFFATFGKKLMKSEYEEIKKNVETISGVPSSLVSELIDEEKSLTKKNDVHVNEEIKANNIESPFKIDENLKKSSNVETNIENGIHNNIEEIQSGINFNNVETPSPQKDNSDDLKGKLISKLVDELDDIKFELNIEPNKTNGEGEIIKKTNSKNESDQKTVENKHNVFNTSNILERATNEIFDGKNPNSNALLVEETGKNNEETETLNKSSDHKTKTQESKLKFLGLGTEKEDDKKVQKELTNESNISKKNTEVDDDDEFIETIEEVVYIDGKDGDEDEEEIIEITETTSVEESPEKLDEFNFKNGELSPHLEPHKEVTTVTTVKKTIRKPSSSSSPEEVIISEETVVSPGTPEHNKKPFGFQFGIGKSGVNMSVGEKQVGIGKSGVKFGKREDQESDTNKDGQMTLKLDKSGFKLNRNKNKSQKDGVSDEHAADVTVGEMEKRDTISPEKEKKSKTLPNFNVFKRSVSHPVVSNAQEVVDESSSSGVSKKSFRGSAGLLKFGKSRSKSTGVMDMDDIITTDVNVMSSFIDHERHASSHSLADLSKVEKTAERNGTVHLIPNENVEVSSQDLISGEKPLKVIKVDEVQSSVGTLNTDLKIGLPEVEKNENRKPIKNIKKPGKKTPGVTIKRGKK